MVPIPIVLEGIADAVAIAKPEAAANPAAKIGVFFSSTWLDFTPSLLSPALIESARTAELVSQAKLVSNVVVIIINATLLCAEKVNASALDRSLLTCVFFDKGVANSIADW